MAIRSNGLFTKCDHPLPGTAMGSCYVYGTSGPGVDLGVQIEFEGSLFLSNAAIKEAAEIAGFNVLEDAVELEQENAHLTRQLAEARTQLDAANEQLDAVSVLLSRAQQR